MEKRRLNRLCLPRICIRRFGKSSNFSSQIRWPSRGETRKFWTNGSGTFEYRGDFLNPVHPLFFLEFLRLEKRYINIYSLELKKYSLLLHSTFFRYTYVLEIFGIIRIFFVFTREKKYISKELDNQPISIISFDPLIGPRFSDLSSGD